jgi:hypothetical protein
LAAGTGLAGTGLTIAGFGRTGVDPEGTRSGADGVGFGLLAEGLAEGVAEGGADRNGLA